MNLSSNCEIDNALYHLHACSLPVNALLYLCIECGGFCVIICPLILRSALAVDKGDSRHLLLGNCCLLLNLWLVSFTVYYENGYFEGGIFFLAVAITLNLRMGRVLIRFFIRPLFESVQRDSKTLLLRLHYMNISFNTINWSLSVFLIVVCRTNPTAFNLGVASNAILFTIFTILVVGLIVYYMSTFAALIKKTSIKVDRDSEFHRRRIERLLSKLNLYRRNLVVFIGASCACFSVIWISYLVFGFDLSFSWILLVGLCQCQIFVAIATFVLLKRDSYNTKLPSTTNNNGLTHVSLPVSLPVSKRDSHHNNVNKD